MRLDTRNKIIRYSLIGFGVAMLLFIVIFNSVWFTTPPKPIGLDFGLAFTIPLLASALSFSISGYFKSFTKEDAKNQIEKQYRNGIISTEHYKKSLRELEMFELEKNRLKAELEMEKQLHKENLMKEVESKIKEVGNERKEQE